VDVRGCRISNVDLSGQFDCSRCVVVYPTCNFSENIEPPIQDGGISSPQIPSLAPHPNKQRESDPLSEYSRPRRAYLSFPPKIATGCLSATEIEPRRLGKSAAHVIAQYACSKRWAYVRDQWRRRIGGLSQIRLGFIDIRGYVKEDGQREGGIEVGQREEGASRFILVGRGIYWLIDIKIVGIVQNTSPFGIC